MNTWQLFAIMKVLVVGPMVVGLGETFAVEKHFIPCPADKTLIALEWKQHILGHPAECCACEMWHLNKRWLVGGRLLEGGRVLEGGRDGREHCGVHHEHGETLTL